MSLTLILLLALQGAPEGEEEPGKEGPKLHEEKDATRCETCREPLKMAIQYVRENFAQQRGNATYPSFLHAGMLFLALGKKDENLQACVDYCKKAYRGKGPNKNWHMATTVYFLSEYYLRYPDEEVKAILEESVSLAESRQEETGGWCHSKGFWRGGYNRVGGGKDITMLTALIYSSLWNIRAAGIEVSDPLLERIEKNLESLSDRRGSYAYGTDNRSGEGGANRGAAALLGLFNAGQTDHKFIPDTKEGLKKRHTRTHHGHASAALHFYAVAVAMYRLGIYDTFAAHWIDPLISKQEEDGSVHLIHDNGKKYQNLKYPAAETATFALMLLLQEPGVFVPGAKTKDEPGASGSGGSRSPFGRKKKRKRD